MSDTTNITAVLILDAANAKLAEWQKLVSLAARITSDKETVEQVGSAFARATRAGFESTKRKILAIQKLKNEGFTEEDIVRMGQEQVLGHFQKERRQEKYEQEVWIRFKIQGSQREIVTKQIERVKAVLGLHTSAEFFDWLYAQLSNTSDAELLHTKGENHPDDQNAAAVLPSDPGTR